MDYYDSSPVPKIGDSVSGNGIGFNKIGGISTLSLQSGRGTGFFMPHKGMYGSDVTASTPTNFGFEIFVNPNGGSYGVYYGSKLLKNFADSTSGQTITGLLTSATPSPTDSGWHTASAGASVYLEIAISSYAITSATIKVDTSYVGGTWVTSGDTQNDGASPANQTFARKLIGEIGDNNVAAQNVFTNLGMMNFCINGIPALYPVTI